VAYGLSGLGMLGAFGTGALQGVETGMDLMDKYRTLQGKANFLQSIGGIEGLNKMMADAQAEIAGGAAPGVPGATPGGAPYATPPMRPGPPPDRSMTGLAPMAPPGIPPGMAPPGTPMPGAPPGGFMPGAVPTPGAGPGLAPGAPARPSGAAGDPAAQAVERRMAGPATPAGAAAMRPSPMLPPGGAPNAMALPPPAPEAKRGTPLSDDMSPREIMNFMVNGVGPFSLPRMAARIEKSMPNASPLDKFYALQAGMKLMNPSGQSQFGQVMSMMNQMRSDKRFEALEGQRQRSEEHRLKAEEMRQYTQLRNSTYVKGQEKLINEAQKQLQNQDVRSKKIEGHAQALSELVKQLQITGNVKIDDYLHRIAAELGWPEAKYQQYKTQLEQLQSELGQMGSATIGALSVSAKADGKALANGFLTPTLLQSIAEAVRVESRITKNTYVPIVNKRNANIQTYMQSKGETIPEEEMEKEPEPAAAPGAAPGAPPPSSWFTP
jgi:hypothetical protein